MVHLIPLAILRGKFNDGASHSSGFSLGHLHMGDLSPPHMGGQVQGDNALMGGGTHEGDIDLMGA